MNRVLVLLAVAAVAALPTLVLAQLAPVPFVAPDAAAVGIELAFEPASYDRPSNDSFTQLRGDGRCSTTRIGGIDVELNWEVKRPEVEAHRVDVSMFFDGFASGNFLTSAERPGTERGLVFEQAEPGIYYYWRLLTRTAEGWRVSGAGRVEAPVCPVDKVYE